MVPPSSQLSSPKHVPVRPIFLGFTSSLTTTILLGAFVFSCSNSNEQPDAGEDLTDSGEKTVDETSTENVTLEVDHLAEHEATETVAQEISDNLMDWVLGDNYGLQIPTGMQACSSLLFSYLPQGDISYVLDFFARISFRPGLYLLPKQQEGFGADLIEKIEWRDPQNTGVSESLGEFVREEKRYQFFQTIDFNGQTMQIAIELNFEPVFGEPERQWIDLDPASLLNHSVLVTGEIDSVPLSFLPCSYDLYDHRINVYTLENGDQLTMELCSICTELCKSSYGGIPRAEIVLNGETRNITDGMRLSLGFGQHTWYGAALVVIDDLLGQVGGLAISFGPFPDFPGKIVNFFDKDLKFLSTTKVVLTEKKEAW
jgi:hypothetical protein